MAHSAERIDAAWSRNSARSGAGRIVTDRAPPPMGRRRGCSTRWRKAGLPCTSCCRFIASPISYPSSSLGREGGVRSINASQFFHLQSAHSCSTRPQRRGLIGVSDVDSTARGDCGRASRREGGGCSNQRCGDCRRRRRRGLPCARI